MKRPHQEHLPARVAFIGGVANSPHRILIIGCNLYSLRIIQGNQILYFVAEIWVLEMCSHERVPDERGEQ